jgi:Ca-activated chloride channel family protein
MFEWAWPWNFILVGLPFLMWHIIPVKKTAEKEGALYVPFFMRLKAIAKAESVSFKMRGFWWCAFAVWCLWVMAMANPKWLGRPVALPHKVRDIMMAIDLSGSMQIADMRLGRQYFSRIDVVKKMGSAFVKAREGDRVGLILFGSKAYVQTPLTFDTRTVHYLLNDSDVGLVGMQTALGEAIALGVKRLRHKPKGNRVLIVLTDGVNNVPTIAPLEAAKVAKELGVRVYTIGIGGKEGVRVMTPFGPQRLRNGEGIDAPTLKKIAEMTGGKFFRATDGQALRQVYWELNRLEPLDAMSRVYRPTTFLYPWPLGLSVLLLLALLFFWRPHV